MRTLKNRLAQLEHAHATQLRKIRCANCRDWPPVRILEIDVSGSQSWTDPDAPAAPRCGWRPVVVQIIEVEDWRTVSRPRP